MNVEYLEFWMLDPFIGNSDNNERGKVLDGIFNSNNGTGGKLIFNLGSVSEDLMKDGLMNNERELARYPNLNRYPNMGMNS